MTPRQQFYRTLGERLQLLRNFHKLTQQEVAEQLGCSAETYHSYENPPMPSGGAIDAWVLMRLAKIFGVGITSIVPPHYEEVK